MMHGDEKSDLAIVAVKPANKDRRLSAESAEPRVGTKGNMIEHGMRRTPGRASMSHGLDRVWQAAKQKDVKFTALLHHVDVELLRSAYGWLRKEASPGEDGVSWAAYGEGLERKLTDLHDRIHRGAYRAQPSRRVYLPKPDGRERPLGIAALEDKAVQRALVEVLNAIWEEDFLGFSYGFRPGRGQHDALDALAVGIGQRKVNWILDADIAGFPRVRLRRPEDMLRCGQPRMADPLCRTPRGRPAGDPTDPQMAESRCGGGRAGDTGGGRNTARRGDLATSGQHLPALRLRSVGGSMAEAPRPRGRHHGAIC